MDWILIRADASVLIGSGHIMRCLSLANELKTHGKLCVFAVRHIPAYLSEKLEILGHDVVRLQGDNLPPADNSQGQYGEWLETSEAADADNVLKAAMPYMAKYGAPDFVVCDHYGLSAKWENRIGLSLSAPVAVIDDLSDRKHDCQWLIDTTFGKTRADYEGLIPDNCHTLIGSEFALLRPEFAAARPKALARRDKNYAQEKLVENLLISMGGMDKDNVSMLMLEALAALPEAPKFETHVLVGPNCPHLCELRSFAKTLRFDVTIHGGVNDVTPLLMAADLCIGAAGSSTWERCCLGIPTINIIIADNQKTIAEKMAKRGAVIDAGFFGELGVKNFSTKVLMPLINSTEEQKSLSVLCRYVCDGVGVNRVIRALNKGDTECIRPKTLLISVEKSHISIIYEWQCDPRTRQYFVNPKKPKWDEHVAWMERKIARTPRNFYIIEYGSVTAGLIRLEPFADKTHKNAWEISILVSPEHYGKKIATLGLMELIENYNGRPLIAHVLDNNMASRKLFLKCGFIAYTSEYYIYLGGM